MNTSEVLNRAADHIQQYGHHKGGGFANESEPYTSPACAVGAMVVASRREESPDAAVTAARIAVKQHLGHFIVGWNDSSDRTAAEVIEVLRATAVIEAAREDAAARESVSA